MAQTLNLRHRDTGLIKIGFLGFSWTTLFFGPFPALFRLDFVTFVGFFTVSVILLLTTGGIVNFFAMVVWAFVYNRYYTRRLIEQGYQLDAADVNFQKFTTQLGIT